ncbi:MAG: cbb3-type cytochrome oxidase assembly protein CcoS [Pseudomonadales bacterium]|nr:cbb3-type cytochrome oxidase assembly protein CcoS [Pseudomonadales bacterium]
MEILYLLIPMAVVLFIVILCAFSWSVKNDQFEDLERHGYDVLFDDDIDPPQETDKGQEQ